MSGPVELVVVGSGDALGNDGRFQTCLCLRGGGATVLIDCGASSLIALRRAGIDPGEVAAVLLTHLHGDHFGGLPFLILDGQFRRRTAPLVVAGPAGVADRVHALMEVLFPGSAAVARRFAVTFVEWVEREATAVSAARVTPYRVVHPSGAPPFALRVEYGGRVVAYTGDTEWTDALVDAARGSDMLVCEAYTYERKVKYHLDWASVRQRTERLGCRRLLLTHMSPDMLAHRADVGDGVECARDGLVLTLS